MRIIAILFALLISGCQENTLTINKIGDGMVFPAEGKHIVAQQKIPVVAYEYLGSYKFDRWVNVQNSSTQGVYHIGNVAMTKDMVITAIFLKIEEDRRWLKGEYEIKTRAIIASRLQLED